VRGRTVPGHPARGRSVSVADDGRGTDTRLDDRGEPLRKPIMSTRDLRFFDVPDPPLLPDGHPRRGRVARPAAEEGAAPLARAVRLHRLGRAPGGDGPDFCLLLS